MTTIAGTGRSIWLKVLLAATVLSRIPFLLTCYSSDPDAWRVVHAGKAFWQSGVYSVSRFPGYPLHEIMAGLTALAGGPFLSNAATLAVSLVLLVVWHRFVEQHTSSPKLLAFLLAFTPLFWVDSAATIDYVWSLLFIILSFSAAQRGRAVPAGLWLGIALGCRPTNAVALIPVLTMLCLHPEPKRMVAGFMLALLATLLAAFSPLLMTYGLAGWFRQTLIQAGVAPLTPAQRIEYFLYRLIYSLGPLAALALVAVLSSGGRTLIRLCRNHDPVIVGSVAGVLVFVGLLTAFPLDASYLLPAIPFLFLIVDRIASRQMLIAFVCCVVSFALINPDLVRHARPAGIPGFNVHPGIVIEEWTMRNRLIQERVAIGKLPIEGKAVVMLGISELYLLENPAVVADTSSSWRMPGDYAAHSVNNPEILFVSGLPLPAVRALKAEGYRLYCLDWVVDMLRRGNGYDPAGEGITPISL